RRAAQKRDERAPPHGGPSSGLAAARYHTVAPERRCASQQKLRADVADGSIASDQDSPDPASMYAMPPIATEFPRRGGKTLSANPVLMRRSRKHRYSITSSARASSVGGTLRPSAFAVLRLTTRENLVGACTGRLAGFSPRRMRSTYEAEARNDSARSTP